MTDTTGGWKIIVSKNWTLRLGDVTGMNMWAPSVYPNKTQPMGGGYGASADCTNGCLYNGALDSLSCFSL